MIYMSCLGHLIWWIVGLSSFEEWVKEASSSEVPQKVRDQRVHIVILWKCLVVNP